LPGFHFQQPIGLWPSAIIEYLNWEKINVHPQRYGCVRGVFRCTFAFQLRRRF
jgi:hypothetical protein